MMVSDFNSVFPKNGNEANVIVKVVQCSLVGKFYLFPRALCISLSIQHSSCKMHRL